MHPIIILGSGLAGYGVAKELRKLDKTTPLIIITADGGESYSKPMLSNALASKKTPAALAMAQSAQMETTLPATLRTRTRVTAIAPERHEISIGDETIAYSKLVLALGAEQIRLPIVDKAGNDADAVLTVNDLDDYAKFRAAIEGGKRVVIIGAGLIGSEFANDLAASGYPVDVIDIADRPLGRLLPPEGGALLKDKLAALGARWHFGAGVQSIDRDGAAHKVTLTTGETLNADVVLSAVGLKPRIDLARAAGLTVNRGIVVNRHMQTSHADIYALGDCVEIEGLVLPYIMPIMHAARALGPTLAGTPTEVKYPAMPVLVKTPACPTVVSPPAPGAVGEWKIEQTADGIKSLFVDASGKLLGFALNGAATAERGKLLPLLPAVLP